MCVFIPGAPPLDLEKYYLPARALATRALCLFCLAMFSEHMLFVFCCFSNTCLRGMCFMFVLLTINIPRSFYFSEYENLTGVLNYWGPSFLGSMSQFGWRDSHFGCVT